MKLWLALFATLSIAVPSIAEVTAQGDLARLRQAGLASDYAYQFLGRLCNQVGPRLSGTPGAEAGVQMVAEEMRRIGLKVTLEPVQVPCWVRDREGAWLTDWTGKPAGEQPLTVLTLGGSGATPAQGLSADVVAVADFEELEKRDVRGKIVLFTHAFDKTLAEQGDGGHAYGSGVRYRVSGPNEAAKRGAVGALVRSVGGANYRLAHTGSTHFDGASIPALAVSAEDSERLAYLAARGRVTVRLLAESHFEPNRLSHNVIGDLVGSEKPEEIVIVSGHLDSWDVGTGALDDGAGVAMAMGAAQLLQELHLKPRRTLRVIGWMNEENGLAGGKTYFEDHKDQLKNHVAALESDMGNGHPAGWECWCSEEFMKRLEPIRSALEPLGTAWLRPATGSGADISPLGGKQGVPCFHPILDGRTYFDYHHTQADTFDKIDPLHLRENCTNMAILAFFLLQ